MNDAPRAAAALVASFLLFTAPAAADDSGKPPPFWALGPAGGAYGFFAEGGVTSGQLGFDTFAAGSIGVGVSLRVDYAGCLTIPIADVATGTIARTAARAPEVVRWLAADDGRFTGPCTYAEGATSVGYLVPMLSKSEAPLFRIHAAGIAAPLSPGAFQRG